MGQCKSIGLWETGSLTAFPSRHAGNEYERVSHLCYVLEADGKKVLILGDSDYDSVFFGRMTGAQEFDAVIANPLFLHLPRGRRVFTQSVRTKKIIFCHLPFAEDDRIHFPACLPSGSPLPFLDSLSVCPCIPGKCLRRPALTLHFPAPGA